MGTSAVFRIDDLSVSLGQPQVEILRGISIDVLHGETLALVGKSGSGKSTLVGTLSGLLSPSGGMIHRSQGRHGDLRTATVFQTAHLFPWLSAVDNVALSLRLRNHPSRIRAKAARRRRAEEIMDVLGIAEFAHRRPHELSGGQQQRVAIARSIVNNPTLILADEPTGALDTKTSADIMEQFSKLNADGTTVVVITHEPEVAEYTSRTVIVRDGKVLSHSDKENDSL